MSLEIQKLIGDKQQDAFGYSIALGDVNGDKKNEVLIASTNGQNGGTIHIYSNNTDKLLKTLNTGKKKVNTIRLLTRDINQDQVDEVILAVTYQDLSGEVKVLSIKDNKTLYHWKSLQSYDAFGFSIASGDIDGDGIPDVIIGAPQPIKDGRGRVYVYSGKDGSLLREFSSKITREHSDFGAAVAVGELDGDGFAEIMIGAPGIPKGEVFIYSGKYGWLVRKLTGEPGFGIMVHTDDIDGDEKNELIVTTKNLEGNKVSVYQGRSFQHLYDIVNDEVDIGFGETMITGDINGDGVKELILGAFDSNHKRKRYTGQVAVYQGTDGQLLHRWYGKEEKDQFGFSLHTGKLYKDNKETLLIGAPREILQKKGVVYIVSVNENNNKEGTS